MLALTAWTTTARAEERTAPEGETFGAAVERRPNWIAGVVLERGVHDLTPATLIDDQLFGLSTTYFAAGRYGIHGRLLASPNVDRFVDVRGLLALGLRLRTKVLGVETFVGAAAHVEARLRTHYWLTYVAPAEIGFTVWQKGSFCVEVFVGARAVVGGDLLNHYLIDPNGVDNAEANAALDAEKRRPWEGYVALVLARMM